MTSAVDTCDLQSELLVSNVDVGETARAGSWKSFSVSRSLAASSSESKSSGYCSKMSPGAPASSPSSSKSRPPPGRNQKTWRNFNGRFVPHRHRFPIPWLRWLRPVPPPLHDDKPFVSQAANTCVKPKESRFVQCTFRRTPQPVFVHPSN